MDDLRWSLLIIGVLLVGGIYLWDRIRRRRGHVGNADLEMPDQELLERLRAEAGGEDEHDLKQALAELSGLRGERTGADELDLDELRSMIPEAEQGEEEPATGRGSFHADDEAEISDSAPARPARSGEDLIIVLSVMAQGGEQFSGAEIREAMEDLDMRHGDMQIFHHHGVGEMSVDSPLFSIANAVEPGVFDLERMDALTTPGLSMFMRLPGPLDGRVAFELMLNVGQRLAQRLGGELRDDTRSALNLERIGHIRERIAEFERRQLVAAE
jgi:cell division protein ZipA